MKVGDNVVVRAASAQDWPAVLNVLQEARLDCFLSGLEQWQDFFCIEDQQDSRVIGCFTFAQMGEVGILKNFAIISMGRKKGLGLIVANNAIPFIAQQKGITKLYLHGNKRPPHYTSFYFWEKTCFHHIAVADIKDASYRDYLNDLIARCPPEILEKEAVFYLEIA